MEGKYSSDPEWASIKPIELNDGSESGAMPLATISYSPEYLEATSYLRAVMAANEMSERALRLTQDIISMNPAHYTVWIYRAKNLFALGKDLNEEIEWLNKVALKHLKNYQIWHHRQVLMSSRAHFPTLPPRELDFLMEMFAQDAKNYHVWTYRHWLVRHFKLWDYPREIQDVEALLRSDVRNNSAWNHRYMLRFGPRDENEYDAGLHNTTGPSSEKGRLPVVDEDLVDAELQYSQTKILDAPENRSPWSYARGVFQAAGRPLSEWKDFARRFVVEKQESGQVVDVAVKSSHAIEWLADVYAEESESASSKEGGAAEAVKMLTLLKEKYDPIRRNYWEYRIRQIMASATQATEISASA
ncbi:protein farnesyltransferase/ geranylgeranyltransferase type-1 subunit alpha [Aspergillus udagawae]|uniref:Protein farnesyltransferase/geranylgeranyltransferase type-1 subunit alpha n=1 Tax=Aspergillus udagawae TaxID=91492 RepID=A0A8H3NAM7_9EURO|nr:protein farnesyltransferase/ geranylgeranyltransferase type-1 subunit alpha [Aspergillus udagawae]